MTNSVAGPAMPAGPAHHDDDAVGRMRAIVDRLAADDFAGRRIATPGGLAAAHWLQQHLQSLGGTTHLKQFPVVGAVCEIYATPICTWTFGGRERRLAHRRDFAEHLASADLPQPVTGPLALIGDSNLDGRWALDHASSPERITQAKTLGAVGALVPSGTDDAGWMPKMIAGPTPLPLAVDVRPCRASRSHDPRRDLR